VKNNKTLWAIFRIPTIFLGYLFALADWVYNWVMSIYLQDPPAHWKELVTGRFMRYLQMHTDRFYYKLASFFCNIIEIADPGHCGKRRQP